MTTHKKINYIEDLSSLISIEPIPEYFFTYNGKKIAHSGEARSMVFGDTTSETRNLLKNFEKRTALNKSSSYGSVLSHYLYVYGLENTIPNIVYKNIAAALDLNLAPFVHRKIATFGCHEAIKHRIDTYGKQGIDLSIELKTLIYSCTFNGEPYLLAVSLAANRRFDYDDAVVEQKLEFAGIHQIMPFDISEIGLGMGRINPFSVISNGLRNGKKILLLFDANMHVNKPCYTNLGDNTFGIEYPNIRAVKDVSRVAIGKNHSRVHYIDLSISEPAIQKIETTIFIARPIS